MTAASDRSLRYRKPRCEGYICLLGPTASGKSDLAIWLAQQFPCEIISVDSGMIYRGMDIGTAKPAPQILKQIPHHLINICDPAEAYSAAKFRTDALKLINEISGRGRIPLLVGGTMLYFRVLQQGISALPQADTAVRDSLAKEANQYGWQKLHERLQQIDPAAAARIAPSDSQRLQRALEVYMLTGKTLTQLCAENPLSPLPYHALNIALAPKSRSQLNSKISSRFIQMLQNGLVAEVEVLFKRGDLNCNLPSMRAVGYRQVWQYLNDELGYDEMQERAIIATRQLAKRQMTWLKTWQNILWFDSEDSDLRKKVLDNIKLLS